MTLWTFSPELSYYHTAIYGTLLTSLSSLLEPVEMPIEKAYIAFITRLSLFYYKNGEVHC